MYLQQSWPDERRITADGDRMMPIDKAILLSVVGD
jgi:hypothetical protein